MLAQKDVERVDCRSEGITNDEACLAYCDFKLDSWAMMNYTDGSFSSCECMDEAKWETGVGETIFVCDVEPKQVRAESRSSTRRSFEILSTRLTYITLKRGCLLLARKDVQRVDCGSERIRNNYGCFEYCEKNFSGVWPTGVWPIDKNAPDGSFASCECVDVDKYDTGVGETIFACDVEHKTVAVNISMN